MHFTYFGYCLHGLNAGKNTICEAKPGFFCRYEAIVMGKALIFEHTVGFQNIRAFQLEPCIQ